MKIYNVVKVPQGLGYDDVDYEALYQSGYTAGYASGYTDGQEDCPGPIYRNKPMTFEILSAGTVIWKTQDEGTEVTIEYSKDKGLTWSSITSTDEGVAIPAQTGDIIQFRGYRGNQGIRCATFSGTTAEFELYGNLMSLVNGDDYQEIDTLKNMTADAFAKLFSFCPGLVDASNLVLPATTLTFRCYIGMFYGCTSLTTAPELPATTLASTCYTGMFRGCTSLTTSPELPATTLTEFCYSNMFENCTSLTTAPELPATILTDSCYNSMFKGCTSLTTAPELPAKTLSYLCYFTMFSGCSNLNYIKCLATDISATMCTHSWIMGVAPTGTFVKDANATWGTDYGYDGIPANWTVISE